MSRDRWPPPSEESLATIAESLDDIVKLLEKIEANTRRVTVRVDAPKVTQSMRRPTVVADGTVGMRRGE